MFKKYAREFLERPVTAPVTHNEPPPLFVPPPEEELAASEPEDLLEDPETIIGEMVTVKGTLSFQRLLRIDGTFEGELLSDGKLIIGPKGSVKADLNLQEAYISGKVEGNITVKERLVLRGRAEIRGNITAPLLSVDEGVSLVGQLHVAPLLT